MHNISCFQSLNMERRATKRNLGGGDGNCCWKITCQWISWKPHNYTAQRVNSMEHMERKPKKFHQNNQKGVSQGDRMECKPQPMMLYCRWMSDVWCENIFSHLAGCIFVSVMFLWQYRSFFSLIKYHLFIFALFHLPITKIHEKHQ